MEEKRITEVLVHKGGNVNVYASECVGCKRHGADVMVSASDADGNIFDIFLTPDQALGLAGKIGKEISPVYTSIHGATTNMYNRL